MPNTLPNTMLRNFALRVTDFHDYDFEIFFHRRLKTIKIFDHLLSDIKLAENVSWLLKILLFRCAVFRKKLTDLKVFLDNGGLIGRGRHTWIGSVGPEKSIRSNFFERATDPILFFREGHRSDPIFSRRPPIRSNFFKNRSDRLKLHCFKLFSCDFRDKNWLYYWKNN
jgi:hypothetical protein